VKFTGNILQNCPQTATTATTPWQAHCATGHGGLEDDMRWSASQGLAWIIRQKPLSLEKNEWTRDMGPKLKDAQRTLAGAISSGRVQAYGRHQRHGPIEPMPADPFRIQGVPVVVGPHGDLTSLAAHKPYEGPGWHSIEFEADEIKREWPKPPPPSATEWMHKEAEGHAAAGTIGKRDVMVRDCMTAIGCTKREAEAAHKSLPDKLKRHRGKPPKNAG
jgi:hypothetical protein